MIGAGATVDWGAVWLMLGIMAAAFVPLYAALIIFRKAINRATLPVWARPWTAVQARRLAKRLSAEPELRPASRDRNGNAK